MTRWYQGFLCKGNPETIRNIVVKQVYEHDLAKFIPSVKPEKLKKNKAKQKNIEFYLFISIESDDLGVIPATVESKLFNFLQKREQEYRGRLHKIIQWQIPDGFLYEEIKKMADADFDVHSFTQSIPYQPHQALDSQDNPFESLENEYTEVERVTENSHNYEKLLYLLSTLGQGTWETFKNVCQALEIDKPRSVQRRLKLLGHLELSTNGKYWSITPTSLVRITPQFEPLTFFLCGQQSGDLLREIEKYATINFMNQPQENAPPRVQVQFTDLEQISTFTEVIKEIFGLAIHHVGDAAQNLAKILPTIDEWKQQLRKVQGIVPSLYDWKYFDCINFVECVLPQKMGMYEMCKTQQHNTINRDSNRQSMALFYDVEEDSWQQGDWYGLRFLALYYSEINCTAFHDPHNSRLAIPFNQRWPEIYERALVLASGLLPSYQKTEQNLWLIYENIDQDLATQLTQKLHINLKEGDY